MFIKFCIIFKLLITNFTLKSKLIGVFMKLLDMSIEIYLMLYYLNSTLLVLKFGFFNIFGVMSSKIFY